MSKFAVYFMRFCFGAVMVVNIAIAIIYFIIRDPERAWIFVASSLVMISCFVTSFTTNYKRTYFITWTRKVDSKTRETGNSYIESYNTGVTLIKEVIVETDKENPKAVITGIFRVG